MGTVDVAPHVEEPARRQDDGGNERRPGQALTAFARKRADRQGAEPDRQSDRQDEFQQDAALNALQ